MRFRILGALEAEDHGQPLSLGGPKQRAVLAHLLLRANRVAPVEVLIAELWGEEPPDSARGTLQAYVSRLRASLGGDRLEGRPQGYVLHVGLGELDAARFESLVGDARADAAEDPAAAVAAYEEALALWRGPALSDLAEESSLAGEIARLEELRLAAIEEKLSAQLALGQHRRIVGQLESLTREHPLRERLWEDLMLALYRSGRQADALAAYQHARQVLADELGIDPSRRLRRLHEQILAQDPGLSSPSRSMPTPARPPASGDLAPDTRVAGYRIEDVLGRGGMSTVYLAEDVRLRRRIALKALAPELARQPGFRERFVRESQIAAGLEHPGIVPIYEAGEADGRLYIAMRYVRGTDLRRLISERGPLDPARAARIVRHVADALDAAHAEGLVHRDVKPGNILLVEGAEGDGRDLVYLSDFGLTKRLEGSGALTRTGQFVGTVDYVAPEQIEGKSVDGRADVYSLGCVLFECLTGASPFHRGTEVSTLYAHVREEPPSATEARPELPQQVDEVLRKALAKDPTDRYATCRELAAAAREVLDPQGSAPTEAAPWFVRRPAIAIAATLLVAVATGALVVGLARDRVSPPAADAQLESTSPSTSPHFPTLSRPFTSDERRLLGLLPSDMRATCAPYRQPAAVLAEADEPAAAVACETGSVDVLYEVFDDRGAMDAAFGKRAQAAGAFGGNCATDSTAQSSYTIVGQEAGRVLCDRSGSESTIAWTDERVLVFGEAIRDDLGDVELYEWWRSAGPIVEGSATEKDPTGVVPKAPEGTYLTAVTEGEDRRMQRRAPAGGFPFRGSWGLRITGGTYKVSQLGRFGVGESGTYVVSKGPRLVLSSECSTDTIGSASYRWRVIGDDELRLTFDRTYGSASTTRKDQCVPGPYPITLHPWTSAPAGEVAYSTAQNQLVLASIPTLEYANLSPPNGSELDNVQPVWSPDGSRVVFASNRDGDWDLYVMDADGSNVEQVTNEPGDELDPAWSPDGTTIAFHHSPPQGGSEPNSLSVLDLPSGIVSDLLVRAENVGRPAWSPDGERIAFRVQRPTGRSLPAASIYVVNSDGSGLAKLAAVESVLDTDPVWTPDGTRILFWGDGGQARNVFLSMRPDGTDVRPFDISLPGDFLTLDWSPGGRWIVLGGAWDVPAPLYLVSHDGKHVFVLEPSAAEPTWRPTGG